MRVQAVIVTFNRLAMLQRLVPRLREVTGLERILVVDNASTDGTGEWLASLDDPLVVHETLATNTGGAGGFHHGLGWAVREGADLVWLMDDDGLPAPDCLDLLLDRVERDGLEFAGLRCWPSRTPRGCASPSGCRAGPAWCTRWPPSRRPRSMG
ncbi:glycosyltransferase [Pimelobacter simplex]|uniref:glycosyltransferase n=1 Tax=Nocardioides simplex TaxID=2045 RepID=UPI00366C9A80